MSASRSRSKDRRRRRGKGKKKRLFSPVVLEAVDVLSHLLRGLVRARLEPVRVVVSRVREGERGRNQKGRGRSFRSSSPSFNWHRIDRSASTFRPSISVSSSAFLSPFPFARIEQELLQACSTKKRQQKASIPPRKTHSPETHDVTASPADRHAAGSLSRFLHAMNASLTPAQVTATCLDAAMSTAETGGGEEVEASLIFRGAKDERGKVTGGGGERRFPLSPPSITCRFFLRGKRLSLLSFPRERCAESVRILPFELRGPLLFSLCSRGREAWRGGERNASERRDES